MGEILVTHIKSIYGDLKGLLSQLPLVTQNGIIDGFIVRQINEVIEKLTQVSNTNYSNYKIPESEKNENWEDGYETIKVRTQLGRIISRLEEEYGFNKSEQKGQQANIVIMNKNTNEISLKIDYTINDLINDSSNNESKYKLYKLNEELKKPNKNWDTIKTILIWILNFSKELFFKILPIILQNFQK